MDRRSIEVLQDENQIKVFQTELDAIELVSCEKCNDQVNGINSPVHALDEQLQSHSM